VWKAYSFIVCNCKQYKTPKPPQYNLYNSENICLSAIKVRMYPESKVHACYLKVECTSQGSNGIAVHYTTNMYSIKCKIADGLPMEG
jgi:hypothetical protein